MLKKLTNFLTKILSGNKNFTGISMDNKLIEQDANTVNNVAVQNNSMYGITYTEARQIAIDIYEQNFPKIQQYAKDIANKRIEKFLKEFMPQIPEDLCYRFMNPDIQYTWNNIAKIAALREDDDLKKILGNLLINKLKAQNSYDSILYSHIIKVAENVSIEEMKILALYYLVKQELINNTSQNILNYLLDFDKSRCSEYLSSLISNGLAYRSGGFAHYIVSEEQGENLEYINQINTLFSENHTFINVEVLNIGEKIAELYLENLNNEVIIYKYQ